jgi:hypothetical protein
MTRKQQGQVFDQATKNSKQDQANAQSALGGVHSGLSDYNARLNTYYANDPYKAGGEYQTTENTIAQDRANANASALKDELQLTSERTGENTAGYANTLAAAQRQGTLDAADVEAKANADRLQQETRYQAYGLDASKFPVQTQEGIYGTSTGGANAGLGTAESAAKQPSFWEQWFSPEGMQAAAKGAATGAAIAG